MRAEVPPSVSPPEPPTPPNAFSISSIQRMHGEIDSATASERRIFDSVEPSALEKSRPASKRSSGIFHAAETAFAQRLLPHPCTPRKSAPFGAGSPKARAFSVNANERFQSHSFRRSSPPMFSNPSAAS